MTMRKAIDQDGFRLLKANARIHAETHNLEATMRRLEAIARKEAPKPRGKPTPESRPWFAREILREIGFIRHHLARNEASWAAYAAMILGRLAMEAEARHDWPEMRWWNEMLAKNREAGRKGGKVRTAKADELGCEVQDLALKFRESTPYDRVKASQWWLARAVATRLDRSPDTVRGHLRRLDIK